MFRIRTVLFVAALLQTAPLTGGDSPEFPQEQQQFFEEKVLGILKQHCIKCHSGKAPKGGLSLTERSHILNGGESGPAVSLTDPAGSLLASAVRFDGPEMPPAGRMSQTDIDILLRWIELKLPWSKSVSEIEAPPEHGPPQVNDETRQFWSFRPVQKTAVPESNSAWPQNPIDQFILQKLHAAGLSPSPRATPQQLIRRAAYDLTGLPPTAEDVDAFAADSTPQAWHAVIEKLLDSPHYGEHWGRHWLDLVRYAETNSYERDGAKPHVWRYRDYVIQSLNDDKPYDRFLTEQLAGDELPDRTAESIVATGFYRLGRWDDEPVDHELAFYDDLDDVLTTVGQSFLGITINCARCHDHKIDPIPQSDYYRMLTFFQNIRRFGVRSAESVADASIVTVDQPELLSLHTAAVTRHEQEMATVTQSLTDIENKIRPDLTGLEIDEFQYEVHRVRIVEKREGGLLSDNDVRKYRQHTSRRNWLRDNRPDGKASVLCVKEDLNSQRPAHVLLRGNPHTPGAAVTAGFPSVLSPPDALLPEILPGATSSGRRLVAARWIASADNPLTARVMVNRIWQYHFGRGIVRTSSDFGFQGSRPTHPELLDWLATEFVERGWSIKEMHRLIMQSAVYQMSSAHEETAYRKDAANDLFWRFDMRRLSAEEIRDSVLAVNGSLNTSAMYGPSVFTKIPDEVKAGQSMPGSGWGESSAADQARRSIYIHVKRSLLDPVLEGFDFADTDQTCPVRFSTTQPTQALAMLNSDFILEQAAVFSHMLRDKAGESVEAQVRLALSRVTQRRPRETEVADGVRLIETLRSENQLSPEKALNYFCLMALNLNEMIYLD